MSTRRNAAASQVVSGAAAAVARSAFAADAIRAASGRAPRGAAPRGMRGSGLFVRNQDGQQTTDPMSLDRIPVRRAVKIGKQYWNSKALRDLLRQKPGATNPLTREPLPPRIVKKYSPRADGGRVRDANQAADMARRILKAPLSQQRAMTRSLGFVPNRFDPRLLTHKLKYYELAADFRGPNGFVNVKPLHTARRSNFGYFIVQPDNSLSFLLELGVPRNPTHAEDVAAFQAAEKRGGFYIDEDDDQ